VAGTQGDITEAVAHLEQAANAVDRLWYATGELRPDQAMFSLGEASLAIHQALVALREWDVPELVDGTRVTGAVVDGR